MVITNQRDFPRISSQVDNKKLKPVEKRKIPASLHLCFVQGLVSCSMGILYKAKDISPQFSLQHLHIIVNIYRISFVASVCVELIKKNSIGCGNSLKIIA